MNGRVELEISDRSSARTTNNCKDEQSPTMESTNVESQEPPLRDSTETSSLLKQEAAPQSPFHTGSERPYHDSTFTFLFLTAILTTFAVGTIASTRADTLSMDTKLRLSNYNPTTNKCEITHQQQQAPKASDSDPTSDSSLVDLSSLFLYALAQTIPFSLSLFALAKTIPSSLLLVCLLRRYTHPLVRVYLSVASFLLLGLVVLGGLLGGLLLFSWCLGVPGIWEAVTPRSKIYLVLVSFQSAQLGYMLWNELTRGSVENGVEVLRTAMAFLKEHFVLWVVNPLLLLGWMVLVNGPIFTFMKYAFNVGDVVPDFDVVNDPLKGCGLATGIRCCREERPMWVYAYITFASITAVWVLMVSMILQHSVVSGTVSLWYFSPKGSSAVAHFKRSLRNAYGPSFGIACNLGTIVTTLVVGLVKFLKKKLSDGVLEINGEGRTLSILQGCSSWMSQFPKHYPQLPSIFLGIVESSKKFDRNLLQQTSPISTTMTNSHHFTDEMLMWISFTCILLQTLVVYEVLKYVSNAFAWTKLLIAFRYCFPIIMVLGFWLAFFSVMKSIFVCYAMERPNANPLDEWQSQ